MAWSRERLPGVLLGLFLIWWTWLAIAPAYRQDWLLENLLVVAAVPVLVWNHRRHPFSNGAYLALFAFGLLHELGAHFTYAEVPYDAWTAAIFGTPLNGLLGLERNHFDRLVHFSYGLLVTPACLELLERVAPSRSFWRWLLPVLFVMSHSALFELVEWAAAEVVAGDLGTAYLGTQGDEWDAQKDMAMAMLGAVLAVAWIGWRRHRRKA